ncbi:hypothetical protein D3C79_856040 [compost metagenome]
MTGNTDDIWPSHPAPPLAGDEIEVDHLIEGLVGLGYFPDAQQYVIALAFR